MSAIISRSKGFIFLKVPKNASLTITTILLEAGLVSGKNDTTAFSPVGATSTPMERVHPNVDDLLKQGLITQSERNTLPVYAFYRDPVDRFLSAYRFAKYTHPVGFNLDIGANARDEIGLDFVVENLDTIAERMVFFKKQSHWLDTPNITIYDLADFRTSMTKFRNLYEGHAVSFLDEYSSVNIDKYSGHNTDEQRSLVSLTTAQISVVRSFYSCDYKFNPTIRVAA